MHAFGTVDLIFSRALMLALIAEFFADQQQWTYQKAKRDFEQSGKQLVPEGWQRADLERGFCVVGLWSFSRHPNFLAEQAFWVMVYQWSCFRKSSPPQPNVYLEGVANMNTNCGGGGSD